LFMKNVLSLMLLSYAFMVSGLLVPVIGGLFRKRKSPEAAMVAMIVGGGTTLSLVLLEIQLPWGLDANIAGLSASAVSFAVVSFIRPGHLPDSSPQLHSA
jgi:SSS family solute:Na+ symporter